MKSFKQIGLSIMTGCMVLSIFTSTVFAQESDEPYGSSATLEDKEYSIEEMLRYAIEDEYVAQAEYQAIIQSFGVSRPFSNIVNAEGTHIEMLLPLFDTHQIALPSNLASDHVTVPETLQDAYAIGVEAELKNIAMYDTFLSQELPEDIRNVFEYLKQASMNHLEAFTRNVDRLDQTSRWNTNTPNSDTNRQGKGRNQ